jgi:hypothetical protein
MSDITGTFLVGSARNATGYYWDWREAKKYFLIFKMTPVHVLHTQMLETNNFFRCFVVLPA